ncbi:hypothetical protein [Chryseobacterium wanjuense]
MAKLIGEDPKPYEKEAESILNAMKTQLWIKNRGYFAEYKDSLENQLLHDKPGIWSIYHVSDAYILNEFEDYQNLQYINNHIPKIPVTVKGAENKDYYTLSTTNWQPYDWSINNVALAEKSTDFFGILASRKNRRCLSTLERKSGRIYVLRNQSREF